MSERVAIAGGELGRATAEKLAADIIVYLVSGAAAPVSGAIGPAYGP